MRLFYFLFLMFGFFSCKNTLEETFLKPQDYNKYIYTNLNETYTTALSEKEFWSKRLRPDSSGVGDLGPLAVAYEALFETTGNVNHLKSAEKLYKKAITISANNKDGYTRSLAHTYISQHRFKEARQLLEESYLGSSHKQATELMLFDVYMELGDYERADTFLGKIKNAGGYNYLIRLAKWNDYRGDLDAAIRAMEDAKTIAESRDSKSLKVWTYTNLADFYGHAGRINDSYVHYLMTLQLQPDNAYAKKSIAWIAFATEENTQEAKRILDSVMLKHKVPEYHLLKAEMAEYDGDNAEAINHRNLFVDMVTQGQYGAMYNTYLIELYTETNPKKALALANTEIENRATPETYQLLAFAQLKTGKKEEALKTIETYVVGKTFEPMAQYYSALIYKANGMLEEVKTLKKELQEVSFELGPVLAMDIESL